MKSSCCVSCDSRLLVTPPRSFLELRARAEPFFPEPFLLDKWRVGYIHSRILLIRGILRTSAGRCGNMHEGGGGRGVRLPRRQSRGVAS